MKSSFTRFFGLGEKGEQEVEQELHIERNEEIKKIPINQIIANRFQPRAVFDEEKIEELARTIHIHGIIQPIVVREFAADKFEIIAGGRRWRAMKKVCGGPGRAAVKS